MHGPLLGGTANDVFIYVRVTDVLSDTLNDENTPGVDIGPIGAITSVSNDIQFFGNRIIDNGRSIFIDAVVESTDDALAAGMVGIPYFERTVRLKNGESVTAAFTDNALTFGGGTGDDIFIYKSLDSSFADYSPLIVEISTDGTLWLEVARTAVGAGSEGFDIDQFLPAWSSSHGISSNEQFRLIRITHDQANETPSAIEATTIYGIAALASVKDPRPNLYFADLLLTDGVASFADIAGDYKRDYSGTPGVGFNADHNTPQSFLGQPAETDPTFVSLNTGGSIVGIFADNVLRFSNSSAPDLYIQEQGPNLENMFVEISQDGYTWFNAGTATVDPDGFDSIDIDAFLPAWNASHGITVNDVFVFVRLVDDPNQNSSGHSTGSSTFEGADLSGRGSIDFICPTNNTYCDHYRRFEQRRPQSLARRADQRHENPSRRRGDLRRGYRIG